MTLTNIFGNWINLNKIISVQCSGYTHTKHIVCDNVIIEVKDKTIVDIVNEINKYSIQEKNETGIFKLELRPISEIETVIGHDDDKDVLVKMSKDTYGAYSFNYVLRTYKKHDAKYWTHFALLP